MYEDDWLEAAYEDKNGGAVDTAIDEEREGFEDCRVCDEPIDYCQGGHTEEQIRDAYGDM